MATLLAASPAFAQANQWTGAVDTDFGKGGNFSAGVPTGNITVDYRANRPVVGGTSTVTSVQLTGPDANISISNGATLHTDALKFGSGTSVSVMGTLDSKTPVTGAGIIYNGSSGLISGGVHGTSGASINNLGTITGGAEIDAGASYFHRGGALTGGMTNAGYSTLANGSVSGPLVNQGNGTLSLMGTTIKDAPDLVNKDKGVVTVLGTVGTFGKITNTATGDSIGNIQTTPGATLSAASLSNGAGSAIENSGKIATTGGIQNAGLINNRISGELVGALDNSGTLNNLGRVSNGITNTGNIINAEGAIINDGLASSKGVVINHGTINGGTTSAGLFSNSATGILNGGMKSSGTTENLGTINDAVIISGGTFDNTGKLAGKVTVEGGTLTSTAAGSRIESGLTNAAVAKVAGVVTGPITNKSGAVLTVSGATVGDGIVTNEAGGTFRITGGNVSGLNTFTNEGALEVSGARTLGTAGLVNAATGSITMQNGAAVDTLTITGPYTGTAGSRIGIDIDTAKGATSVADKLVVNGKATGTSSLDLAFVGAAGLLAKPVEIVTLGAGSTLTLNTGRVASRPYVNYYLSETAAGSGTYQISSQFDAAPLTSIAASVDGGMTSYHAALHQPIKPLVSRPVRCRANAAVVAPFVRAVGGEETATSRGSFDGGAAEPAKTSNRLFGVQGGIDVGLCNIGDGGVDVHVGVTGGHVGIATSAKAETAGLMGSGAATTTSSGDLNLPFFGAYAIFSGGGFNLELGARHERLDGTLQTVGAGGSYPTSGSHIKGQGWSVNGLVSYKIIMPYAFFIEPHLGFSSGSMNIGTVTLSTGPADTLALGKIDTGLVRGGVNIGTALRGDGGMIVSPFAHFSLWSRMGGGVNGQANLGSMGVTGAVKNEPASSFAQAGGGLMVRSARGGLSAFVRADLRLGEGLQGYTFNGGLRVMF